jgi:hypothetical protein
MDRSSSRSEPSSSGKVACAICRVLFDKRGVKTHERFCRASKERQAATERYEATISGLSRGSSRAELGPRGALLILCDICLLIDADQFIRRLHSPRTSMLMIGSLRQTLQTILLLAVELIRRLISPVRSALCTYRIVLTRILQIQLRRRF